jgi:hypothetical protein
MSYFRIDDRANDNPKLLAISDGAFRLWVEGGLFCNRHLTDGLILDMALRGFRYATKKRVQELTAGILWDAVDGGYRMHDYLDWNDSKDVIEAKKQSGRERVKRWRNGDGNAVSNTVGNALPNAYTAKGRVVSLSGTSSERTQPDASLTDGAITERAGRFIERYESLYVQHRSGARYLVKPHRDYEAAVGLCRTWADDDRLDKLAAIFLTTNHQFAESGSRTIPQFAALASWCDSKLTEWEAAHAVRS